MAKRKCIIKEKQDRDNDVFILHGHGMKRGSPFPIVSKFFLNQNYNLFACDIETKKDDDWVEVLNEYEKMIRERIKKGKHVNLVGESMGGTLALSLGEKIPEVKKVFAIGAVHGKEMLVGISKDRQEYLEDQFNKKYEEINIPRIIGAFPDNFEICKASNKNKYYLIHSQADKLVTFDQFIENKKELCLPDENTLVYDTPKDEKSWWAHVMPGRNWKTIEFIEKNL